jgi:signal transduction histidine kinase
LQQAQRMGIGLSIARTIVEAHNGQIFAENQTGGGAIFRIQLPLSHQRNRSLTQQSICFVFDQG